MTHTNKGSHVMTKKPAELIKTGDMILPPEREMRLWMRRTVAERGLSESALHLTVTETYEGNPDKRGRWIIVEAKYPLEWNSNNSDTFTIKARPETPWPVIG
jgi:hypothetical protein